MRQGGGKQKGAAFERHVCERLSTWVSNGKSKDLFWRSAMSGGRATVASRKGEKHKRHAGDVTATSALGEALTSRFFIECKCVKKLAFDSFLIDGKGELSKYWRTACAQAKGLDLSPMLIAKENRRPPIVFVRCGELRRIALKVDSKTTTIEGVFSFEFIMLVDLLSLEFKVHD